MDLRCLYKNPDFRPFPLYGCQSFFQTAPNKTKETKNPSPGRLWLALGEGFDYRIRCPEVTEKFFLKDLLGSRKFHAFEDAGCSEIHRVHPVLSAYGSRYGSEGCPHTGTRCFRVEKQEKPPFSDRKRWLFGYGGRTRTYDLRVMSCGLHNFCSKISGFRHLCAAFSRFDRPPESTQSTVC